MKTPRDLNHYELCDACSAETANESEREYKDRCYSESQIRSITGSSVDLGKSYLKGVIEMYKKLGSKKTTADGLLVTLNEALTRTDSKVLTTAIERAIKTLTKRGKQ